MRVIDAPARLFLPYSCPIVVSIHAAADLNKHGTTVFRVIHGLNDEASANTKREAAREINTGDRRPSRVIAGRNTS